jgi:class 3 adenylate cyclase/TolB-like protein/Tfp pilus assembly protein PilF
MNEIRKLAAILVADVVGFSRLAGADEDRTLARLKGLWSDLIDPAIAAHHGRVVKRTGDGSIIEFRSVVEALRCAIEVQSGLIERNAGVPQDRRIEFRVGIHVGDVVEESDGELMGDGVNIAARLEGIAKPGGICLSEQAYWQVKGRLDLPAVDLGPIRLKNIAEPIRIYFLQVGVSPPTKPVARPPSGLLRMAILGAIVAAAALGWHMSKLITPGGASPAAASATTADPAKTASAVHKLSGDQYSVVVLPFRNISGDPSQEYFADGITETLTTDLSQISGSYAPFSVIARNTAFTYKGRNVDVREMGNQVGARYAIEGSVQRDQGWVRVNVQLIDAESGSHVWTTRLDKPLADLFGLQDEIVKQIGGQLKQELGKAEMRRSQAASNPNAMDLYNQAIAQSIKGSTLDSSTKARDLCRRAITLDPDNATARQCAASFDFDIAYLYRPDKIAEIALTAESEVGKALSIEPNNGEAHLTLCYMQISTGRTLQGMSECERALALDPSNAAVVHDLFGRAMMYLGRAEETEGHIAEGLRLNPSDPGNPWLYTTVGRAKLLLGADEDATAWLRRAIERNRNQPLAHFYLAAALARLGQRDEARAEMQAGLVLDPDFTIARARSYSESDNPTYLAQRDRLFEALRGAGAPEG